MIKYTSNDEQFDLNTQSNQDIFLGLKDGLEDSARTLKQFNSCDNIDISLDDSHSSRKQAYGTDGNIYPNVLLSTTISNPAEIYSSVNAIFTISPFGGTMTVFGEGIKIDTTSPEELNNAVQEYMQRTFPKSDYDAKLKKYQEATRIKNKVYDEMVFGK